MMALVAIFIVCAQQASQHQVIEVFTRAVQEKLHKDDGCAQRDPKDLEDCHRAKAGLEL